MLALFAPACNTTLSFIYFSTLSGIYEQFAIEKRSLAYLDIYRLNAMVIQF